MDDCNLSLIIWAQTVNISLQDALALEMMERLIFLWRFQKNRCSTLLKTSTWAGTQPGFLEREGDQIFYSTSVRLSSLSGMFSNLFLFIFLYLWIESGDLILPGKKIIFFLSLITPVIYMIEKEFFLSGVGQTFLYQFHHETDRVR
jgi:hypothetical protein